MPGRGQPWKKGGLVDETVTEADLGPTLADKINTGGGGAGTLDDSLIQDDFDGETAYINNKYNVANGNVISPGLPLAPYGVVEVDSATVGTESSGELTTSGIWFHNPQVNGSEFKMVPRPESNAQFQFYGLTSSGFSSVTTVASINASDIYGFIHDPAINNNWQAISRTGSVNTIVDTGIAITVAGINKLDAVFDKVAGEIVYTIGGSGGEVVATITTNLPTGADKLFGDAYAVNTVSVRRSLYLDFWEFSSTRA